MTTSVAHSAIGPSTGSETGPLVLYDGGCGLCAKSVRWILRHERDSALRFAPLQGTVAAACRARHPAIPTSIDTFVYIADGRAHVRSKALFYLARHLRAPWRWMYAFRWFPAVISDLGYRVVARLRFRMFGRVDACELPSPAHHARFLD